jgi:hypothetical protein
VVEGEAREKYLYVGGRRQDRGEERGEGGGKRELQIKKGWSEPWPAVVERAREFEQWLRERPEKNVPGRRREQGREERERGKEGMKEAPKRSGNA